MVTIYSPPGDNGFTQYRVNSGTADVIDCSSSWWDCVNYGSPQQDYPVMVNQHLNAVDLRGGEIIGSMSLTVPWGQLYSVEAGYGNSASVFIRYGENATGSSVTGWRIDRVFDGIRITFCEDFLIDNNHISRARDDGIEVDTGMNGTISNCLIEDVYVGFSIAKDSLGTSVLSKTINVNNVLIKCSPYPHKNGNKHAAPIKSSTNAPGLILTDTILAISQVDHEDYPRLEKAFARILGSSSGNYFLNLSDDPLPGNYPVLPPSFTYLSGQPARDYWDAARTAFLAEDPLPEPEPDPDTSGVINAVTINPTSGAVRAFTADVFEETTFSVTATNSSGSDTETINITVETP